MGSQACCLRRYDDDKRTHTLIRLMASADSIRIPHLPARSIKQTERVRYRPRHNERRRTHKSRARWLSRGRGRGPCPTRSPGALRERSRTIRIHARYHAANTMMTGQNTVVEARSQRAKTRRTHHIVQAVLPERSARQDVELRPGRAFREDSGINSNLRGRQADNVFAVSNDHVTAETSGRTWPCRTRVYASHWSCVGRPKWMVRVVSQVPSRYWPPESLWRRLIVSMTNFPQGVRSGVWSRDLLEVGRVAVNHLCRRLVRHVMGQRCARR